MTEIRPIYWDIDDTVPFRFDFITDMPGVRLIDRILPNGRHLQRVVYIDAETHIIEQSSLAGLSTSAHPDPF